MTREKVWARMSTADQERISAIAAGFGWSGLELTAWLLSNEIDGIPVEAALEMIARVHTLTALPEHSRRVLYAEGKAYTAVTLPWRAGGDNDSIWLPPVPGKDTWTLVRADPPPLLCPDGPAS